jgi:hypothetical protein
LRAGIQRRCFASAPASSNLVVVTSEDPLLRRPTELRRFLDRHLAGETTYSWEWDRHDVSSSGSVAWLLAEGTEIAAREDRSCSTPTERRWCWSAGTRRLPPLPEEEPDMEWIAAIARAHGAELLA